jgi:hypothetical protein
MPLRTNETLLAQATRAAEQPGHTIPVQFPNGRITTDAPCDYCGEPLPVPRRADKLYCDRACGDAASRLRRDDRRSLDG